MKKIKIALVDDESLFLEGLSLLFTSIENIRVVAQDDGGIPFLKNLESISPTEFPDIALVDIQMKPMDGFELVEKLKQIYPDLKIIVLSTHYKNAMFGHMIKLGVSAFLPKNSSKKLLTEAIETVHRSGVFYSQNDHQMLSSFVRNESKRQNTDPRVVLSEREIDVVKLICEELTNQEIADKLFLSKRTVENHRQRILDKIGATNMVGIVIYAISHEIFVPEIKFGYMN